MKLSVFKDNAQITSLDLSGEVRGNGGEKLSFFIGRSDSCHIILKDQQVSREHAQLNFENNVWSIQQVSDYGQIAVNGSLVQEVILKNGDMINIGPFSIYSSISNSAEVSQPEITQDEILPEPMQDIDSDEVSDEGTKTITSSGVDLEEVENEQENGFFEEDNFSDDESDPNEFPEDNDGLDEFEQDSDMYEMEVLDDDIGEKTQVIQSFARFELELFGELAPYDKYIIENDEVIIGRDPAKAQIVLNDPEVSSTHAALKRNNVICTIKDLQSGNGTLLNGERINQAALTNGDEFIIGSTTFTVRISSDLIQQEENRLMPVEENQVVEVEEIVEVGADFEGEDGEDIFADDEPEPKSLVGKLKRAWKYPEQRRRIIIYGSVGILLLLLFLPTPETKAPKPVKKQAKVAKKVDEQKKGFSQQELERIDPIYQLVNRLVKTGKYNEAILNLNEILQLSGGREYKNTKQLREIAKNGLKKLEEIEKKRREEEERKLRALKVKQLVEKATKATEERRVELAEKLFAEIKAIDPENLDVSQLELDLKAWQDEQNRKRLEEAEKKAERNRKLEALKPGKQAYLQKKWFLAIDKLEKFLGITDMDADLTAEGTKMLNESKRNLNSIVQPLLGRARSLREGQDLKGSYENYKEILKYEPTNEEALNEMDQIQNQLFTRARKIYREAIIAESLYLFDDAKEKFQEVQQISPSDSEYYKKATSKLKEYVD